MAISGGTRLGSYEFGDSLGVGGMGEVYRAKDLKLKREVAIKVLPESLAMDAERLARFQREAEILASLNHANIAQIFGLEKAEGVTALVMELIEGPTLADRIQQGPLPVEEALGIAMQIAAALEAAHGRGIIHRDLKPANIKLRPDGTVKVLDFGIAKALEAPAGTSGPHSPALTTPAMTMSGIILGTAAYMSPEQARGKTVDERADIWAFGCVLFEMLTGQPVFGGEDITTTLARVLEREVDLSAMVYRSSGSGAFQVMVQPFPPDGSSTRVSPAGEIATRPVWSADGSTLYYQGPANQGFSAVDIAVPGFALRNRRELPHRGNPNAHRLAVMPDGKLVLTIPQAAALGGTVMRTELVVVENWIEEVKQRVPRN